MQNPKNAAGASLGNKNTLTYGSKTQKGSHQRKSRTVLEPSGGQNMQVLKQAVGVNLGENNFQTYGSMT